MLGSVAVSPLLLLDLEFDFIDFLISVRVSLSSMATLVTNTALAGRDGHDAY